MANVIISPHIVNFSPARYLLVFGGLVAGLLLLVVMTNYLIDPYLCHQWDSPALQNLRPAREKLSPWGKTYAVFRYQPQVLYVGNSRTEEGLPAETKLFSEKRVFNGGISGASLGDAIAMLNHATAISQLDAVVWGVDYWTFSPDIGNTDFDRNLVATNKSYAVSRLLLDLKRSLSFDMTYDSINLIRGTYGTECKSSLAFGGQRDEICNEVQLVRRGNVSKAATANIRAGVKNNKNDIAKAFTAFRLETDRLCRAGIRLMIYINPLHAITLEDLYQTDHGAEWEEWKRLLVNASDQARQRGCQIQLFDFSGFNSVTSESIPEVTGKARMRNYWEVSHYRSEIGRQILARMIPLTEVSVPDDFGVELDHNNIDAHLMRIRSERERYRSDHARELALLETWFGKNLQK